MAVLALFKRGTEMESTTTRSELRSPLVQPAAPRRTAPVRLPQATADLVNRMLAARCGAAR
jgi:hypothetical protein